MTLFVAAKIDGEIFRDPYCNFITTIFLNQKYEQMKSSRCTAARITPVDCSYSLSGFNKYFWKRGGKRATGIYVRCSLFTIQQTRSSKQKCACAETRHLSTTFELPTQPR